MQSTDGKYGCRTQTRLNSRKQSGFMEIWRTKTDRGGKSTRRVLHKGGTGEKNTAKTAEKANGISGQCVQTP